MFKAEDYCPYKSSCAMHKSTSPDHKLTGFLGGFFKFHDYSFASNWNIYIIYDLSLMRSKASFGGEKLD